MPGFEWENFANVGAYFGYLWGHPGKKLLFMGCEFGQWEEWNHDASLDWDALHGAHQRGTQQLVRDLNHLYRTTPALYSQDCEAAGFEWLENDPAQSITAFARYGSDGSACIVACNFTPVERQAVRLPVPAPGRWVEALNTDAEIYGGGNRGNLGGVWSQDVLHSGKAHSIEVTLPPLSTLIFKLD